MPARDRLRAEKLRGGFVIGRKIIVVEEADSTNDMIAQMAAGDWPEGFCVFAERQLAGRGQRGNEWESAAGKGLWFSILLRPKIEIAESARLTTWVAETIATALRNEFGLSATVKPPNDVYVDDRKIAGVLVEMRAQPGTAHVAVIGVGLNVNHMPADFSDELRRRATSLLIVLKRKLDRNQLAATLLKNFDASYGQLFE
jgi:BirA family transcriptional regulator, biotin operon repressor / biotin---[acetyl-CoA-carboxylase] ligase